MLNGSVIKLHQITDDPIEADRTFVCFKELKVRLSFILFLELGLGLF